MPFSPNQNIVRSFVAPSSGSRFLTYSGVSGNLQIILIGNEEGLVIIPTNESTSQTTNQLLSGLNEISVAQSGIWQVGQSGTWTFNPGQNFTGTLVNGTIVGISGGTFLTGTNIVGFNNQSIRVAFSGENLSFVTPSGTFNVTVNAALPAGANNIGVFTLNTGVVSTSFAAGNQIGVTGGIILTGSNYVTTSLSNNITGSVTVSNSPTVVLTAPISVNLTGANQITLSGTNNVSVTNTPTVAFNNASIQAGQSGAFTVILTGTNNVGLNAGSNLIGSVSQGSSWPVNLTGINSLNITGLITASVVPSGSFAVAVSGNPLVSVNANSNVTGSLVSGTQVGLSGDSVVILKSGVLSTDINYREAKSYKNTNINTGHFEVKTTSGSLTDLHIFNFNSQQCFVHFFDEPTGQVDHSNTTALRTYWIPALGAIDNAYSTPVSFTGAINLTASLTISSPAALTSGLLITLGYL